MPESSLALDGADGDVWPAEECVDGVGGRYRIGKGVHHADREDLDLAAIGKGVQNGQCARVIAVGAKIRVKVNRSRT